MCNDSEMSQFERMLKEMDALKISKAEMARRLEVSDQRFGNWKRRGAIPKEKLPAAAKVLRVNLHYLMTGEGAARKLSTMQRRISDMMLRNDIDAHDLEMLTRNKVSAAVIQSWLNGEAELSDTELTIVAPHLGMPADYFRTGVNSIKQMDGPSRKVLELPEGYEQASHLAQTLSKAVIQMSSNGQLPDEKLEAMMNLLNIPAPVAAQKLKITKAQLRKDAEAEVAKREKLGKRKLSAEEKEHFIQFIMDTSLSHPALELDESESSWQEQSN